MLESQPLIFMPLLIAWAAITVVLVILMIYRGALSAKEDDQIFIGEAEQHRYQEQQLFITRISRLTKPIIVLAVMSGVLLLTSAGIWIYQGLKSF